MDVISNCLVGIGASVIGGIVLVGLASIVSRRARWVLTATLGRILDIDTEYVFPNSQAASADVQHELRRATRVDLLTGRGNEIQRAMFSPLLEAKRAEGRVRMLLPIVEPKSGRPDWTQQRELELAKVDQSFGSGMLKSQIMTTIKFLEPYVQNGILELRLFDAPHLGRVLLTDRCAYFTPYRRDAHGRDCRVIKYRRGGDMYDWLKRLFCQQWDASIPPQFGD